MAHNRTTMKMLSETMKNGGKLMRNLHVGAASKMQLHKAESLVAADSAARSRVKASACDIEKNAVTKVGPSPDILHQVPVGTADATGPATAETENDRQDGYSAADPNSSMWNLCKSGKDSESTVKKLTLKFRKMKDNIKQYYLDRIEENQVIFAEVDEPLRIGKLDRKDRLAKYKEMRDEDIAPLDEVQVLQRPPRRTRKTTSLFSKLQTKPEVDSEEILDTTYSEVKSEPQIKGYKKFSKLDYKKSGEEIERDGECRNVKLQCKAGSEELVRNERCYGEERALMPSIWKRPQIKEKEAKDRCGDGGLSDVLGTMSPAAHFRNGSLCFRTLLNTIKSGDVVQNFYKRQLCDSRYYSTLLHKSPLDILGNKMPEGCSFSSSSSENVKELVGKMVPSPSLSSTKRHNSDDPCRPQPLPPKVCQPDEKLPKCPTEPYPWPPCPKICLCGCEPPNPRSLQGTCNELIPLLSLAKRPEYICPAFSECQRRTEMNTKRLSECCIVKKSCDSFVGPTKRFVTAQERQEMNLGQKYWSAQKQQCSCFHSSAKYSTPMAEEECDRPAKNQLPCQRTVNIPGVRKKEKPQGKGSCDKLCMPCCEPARDPPECLSIYQKPPCTKFKNPRPSFSECRKKFPFKHSMCECEVPSKPKCEEKKKKENVC